MKHSAHVRAMRFPVLRDRSNLSRVITAILPVVTNLKIKNNKTSQHNGNHSPTGLAAAGSGAAEDNGFLWVIKIPSTHFLRRGSKAVGPMS
jgi:hypothetical protein